MSTVTNCPCGSGLEFQQCCGRLLDGSTFATNAEQLMRSRYSAFSLGKLDYLQASWHPDFVPDDLTIDPAVKWIKLRVVDFVDAENTAVVEFEASFLVYGRVEGMHERSRFVCQQGRWLYTDGDPLTPSFKAHKPARNEPCPCGSGKKYKRCCA